MENFNNVPSSGTFGSVVSVVNQNFALAKEAIDKLAFSKSACKGFYETSSELNEAHPTPTDGDWALVGDSSPFNVYVANDGSWVDSGVDYNVSIDNSIEINGLGGYVVLDSVQELPASPSNPNLGYLIGTHLYVYVGTGGDTLDGKYKDCGEFRGPEGKEGKPGADGHDGVSLGEVAIVDNLTEGGSDKVLSGEMGKVLKQAATILQYNLTKIISSLANLAFTDERPSLIDVTFDGSYNAYFFVSITGGTFTDNATNGHIQEGSTYRMVITPQEGYEPAGLATISVKKDNVEVPYRLVGNALTIENVSGFYEISIVSLESSEYNPAFKNVRVLQSGTGYYKVSLLGAQGLLSELVPVGLNTKITFYTRNDDNYVIFFDRNREFIQTYRQNANPRTVNIPQDAYYVRLSTEFGTDNAILKASYMTGNDTTVKIWDGNDVDLNDVANAIEYMASSFGILPDINGNIPAESAGLSSVITYQGENAESVRTANLLLSQEIELPEAVNGVRTIKFWAGESTNDSNVAPFVYVYNSVGDCTRYSSAGNYSESSPRVVNNIESKYTHCRMLFHADKYYDNENYAMYIKDVNDNVLWSNSSVIIPNQTTNEEE